ncbi:hypothetical protein N9L68_06105 [bacterium]|nr:hypothetical protein [bacterium]
MADWSTGTATCVHCSRATTSTYFAVGQNAGYHGLCAQGWFKSPATRDWSCTWCASETTYWTSPVPGHLSTDCVHRGLLDDHPGLHGQAPVPPSRPADSPRRAINDIIREFEAMGARLAELSLPLRDLLDRQQKAQSNESDGRLGRRGLDVAAAIMPLVDVTEK